MFATVSKGTQIVDLFLLSLFDAKWHNFNYLKTENFRIQPWRLMVTSSSNNYISFYYISSYHQFYQGSNTSIWTENTLLGLDIIKTAVATF